MIGRVAAGEEERHSRGSAMEAKSAVPASVGPQAEVAAVFTEVGADARAQTTIALRGA